MNYIIYQVHGNIDFYNEALFSILSYYKHNKESKNRIVIYTENEQFFKNILPSEVVYINITPEKIKEWRGKINFVHLVKIKIIQDIASRYNGNFLYLDTDTFFTSKSKIGLMT
jgi:predicted glutamine amidotransferase